MLLVFAISLLIGFAIVMPPAGTNHPLRHCLLQTILINLLAVFAIVVVCTLAVAPTRYRPPFSPLSSTNHFDPPACSVRHSRCVNPGHCPEPIPATLFAIAF